MRGPSKRVCRASTHYTSDYFFTTSLGPVVHKKPRGTSRPRTFSRGGGHARFRIAHFRTFAHLEAEASVERASAPPHHQRERCGNAKLSFAAVVASFLTALSFRI
ncbi:hypothetical protein CEXT_683671 [Caerostris extrusa]|uniref:Uncharacterized protein n=1 Tax=Caerostris extrusa TaxID=172846 RepID=A0AAV4Q142_CAEEX|nr:hypothetical protein CEXT_683671 [Caerostris extrusa]